MDELNKYKASWNKVTKPEGIQELSNQSVMEQLIQLQKKIVFNNLFASVTLSLTIIFLALVYDSFDNPTKPITYSIGFICVLLLFSLYKLMEAHVILEKS